MGNTIDAVLERLAEEPCVWVRLVAVHGEDGWKQLLLELTTGAPPPSFVRLRWQYRSALLLSETRKGTAVVGRLRSGRWQVGHVRVKLDTLASGDLSWDQRASNEVDYGGEPLAWPSRSTTITQMGGTRPLPSESLVADGLPTFLSVSVAIAHLLHVPEPQAGGFNTPRSRLRMQDTRARLSRVRIHSDHVEVSVEGPRSRGLICELAGRSPGPVLKVNGRNVQHLRFDLNGTLGADSWVVLHDGDRWLDRRFLNVQWVRPESDVEVVFEPRSHLESIIGGHEGPDVEFKQVLPGDTDGEKRSLMKTVGAFANGNGGTIAFGITDDEVVVGLERASLRKSIDRLVDLVERWIEPHPTVTFQALEMEGTDDVVLLMTVAGGLDTPYCVGTPGEDRRVYVRRHGHTRPANQREMRLMVMNTVTRDPGGLSFPQ